MVNSFIRKLEKHWVKGLILIHISKVVFWFRNVDFASGFPLTNVDYIQYYARVLRAHHFWTESGRYWGYDPFNSAGYVSGLFNAVGTYFSSLLCHVLSPLLPIHWSLLLIEFLSFLLMPFLLVLAVRNFGGTRNQAWTAFALAVFTFGIFEIYTTRALFVGLWGFFMASFVGIYQVSLCWRWSQKKNIKNLTLLAIVTSILFQIHPIALISILIPNMLIYFFTFRSIKMKDQLGLCLALVFVLVSNWYWIHPFIAFSHWRVPADYFLYSGFGLLMSFFFPFQALFFHSFRFLINCSLIILTFCSFRFFYFENKKLCFIFASWIAVLAFISFFGARIPLFETLQPSRNITPLWFLLVLVSSFSFKKMVWDRKGGKEISILLACLCLVFLSPALNNLLINSERSFRTSLYSSQSFLIEYLKKNHKPLDGRVLIETNDSTAPHVSDIVPWLTGALVMGGPHPGTHMQGRFSRFSGIHKHRDFRGLEAPPIAFGRFLKEWDEQGLREYLDLYNVNKVVAFTEETKKALERFSKILLPVKNYKEMVIYSVANKNNTWFREGTGDVEFDFDRIKLSGLSKGKIILKTHWLKTLESDPKGLISPVHLLDDPIPFIEVDNRAGFDHVDINNVGF